jgi:hypothetical protein
VLSVALSLLCVRKVVIMAEDPHFWVEIENEDEVMFGIDVYHGFMQVKLRDLLDEMSEAGVYLLAKNVPNTGPPYSTGYTLQHVDRSGVSWDEGATGKEFETTVGIRAGKSFHPVYVNRGTGEFGPFIKRPYTTKPPGGLMWFHASRIGARIGRESVRGQRAQHFLYTTFRELQVFAQARITTGGII